ncbi:MAG: zf-HC2 domain-containing protein [Anaerolineae bacterium]|nr:zf-HC2 domain-containing protein [Anaerolineae bacterium]
MMNCRDVGLLMSLALDQSLTQVEARGLEDHLKRCPTCQEEWEAMQRISRLFADAPLMGPLPGFADRVMQRLARRQARRRRLLAGAALLVVCLSLGALALPGIVRWLALLWQVITEPSLLSHGAKLIAQLLNLAESLGRACWLVIIALFSSLNQPALLGYSFLVLTLTALWIRLVAGRRGEYQPVINNV